MRINARIVEIREVDVDQASIKERVERIIRKMHGMPILDDIFIRDGKLMRAENGEMIMAKVIRDATVEDEVLIRIIKRIHETDWNKL